MSQKKLNNTSTRNLLVILLFPLLLLFLFEGIHRGSFIHFMKWGAQHFISFFVTYLFFLSIICFFYIFPRKIFIFLAFLQLIIWPAVALVSYKKFQLRGDYLSPFDVFLLREGADISKYISNLINMKMIAAGIGLLIAGILLLWLMFKTIRPESVKKRLMIASSSLLIAVMIIQFPQTFYAGNSEKLTDIQTQYENRGFVGGFLNVLHQFDLYEPKEYNREEIDKLVYSLEKTDKSMSDSDFQPNVIVVLAEALWDPLLLEEVKFKEDPIPYFRSLTENHTSGTMVTHVFGGGTINTELEVLTGLTTRFLPPGSETYNHYMTRPTDSLAHVFGEQGYNTTAVHTFKNWFYNRQETYKWLGFQKFISMEFFNNPNYIGPYIDDRLLMEKTLEEIKKSDGPDFVNTVTVSSHGPYDDIRYDHSLKDWTDNDLTKVPEYILNLYAQVLNELDESIKVLVEGAKELDEPTIIAIYGDHLPMLGYDYAVYREGNYFSDLNSYEDYMKMHSTPLLVWDNFSDTKDKEELRMTPNFLGAYLLNKAKKEKSPIFRVTDELYNKGVTVIPRNDFFKDEGINEQLLNRYQLLQHDVLSGEQYSYQKKKIKPFRHYHLGSGIMKIQSAKLSDDSRSIILTGESFYSDAEIYINGKKQKSIYKNETEITTTAASEFQKGDTIKVQMKLFDDKDKVVAETEETNITLD